MDYFIGFLLLLSFLVFVHEFGHFIVAKLVGVKVLKFSLFFGPPIISRKWGETEYLISSIPLGGYVKLLGETPDTEEEVPPEEKDRAFTNKPLLARMGVIVAGPFSNFITAVVVLSIGFFAGMPVHSSKMGEVLDNSPAMIAGIQPGDRMVEIAGKPITRWDDMTRIIRKSAGKALPIVVERNGKRIKLTVTPRVSKQKDAFGNPVGLIGVKSTEETIKLGIVGSIQEGWRSTIQLTSLVLETVVKLLQNKISKENMGGPIMIIQASGQSLKQGPLSFMYLLAFISVNLAILNLLPIPVLDGGHLLFFLIEAVIRRPVTGKIREVATLAGVIFIVSLMALVFYNDIMRIIQKGWELRPPQ